MRSKAMEMEMETDTVDRLASESTWLRRLSRSLVRCASDGDELYQETVVTAWESGPRAVHAPRSWLAGIARKKVLRASRAAGRRARREQGAARSEAVPSTADLAERAELRRMVQAAVRALGEPYRTAILLRFFDDLKPARIAARTGVPVETVRTRVRRGLALLRAELDSEFGERTAWLGPLVTWAGVERSPARLAPAGAAPASFVAGLAAVAAAGLALAAFALTAGPAPAPAPAAEGTAIPADVARSDATVPPVRVEVAVSDATQAGAPSPGHGAPSGAGAATTKLCRASELAVLDVMRKIIEAQAACRSQARIDVDEDGAGEHGYLAELAGGVAPRGSVGSSAAERQRKRLLLHPVFRRIEGGVAELQGYCFRMFLPGQNGTALEEADGGGAGPIAPDPDLAEKLWCCYAWPAASHVDGRSSPSGDGGCTFFVDQEGQVLVADSGVARYLGRSRAPLPGAAFRRGTEGRLGAPSAGTDPNGLGQDGQSWLLATGPAEASVVVEVADPAGRPIPGVQVYLVPSSMLPDAERRSEAFAAQAARLRETRLPIGQAGTAITGVTGAGGKVELRGHPVSGVAILLSKPKGMKQPLVPERIDVGVGLVRIELPPPPQLEAPEPNANESAVIATLKNISSAQAQFQASGVVDVDQDGAGEFGYFGEMSGACPLRAAGGRSEQRMSPPVLSAAFGRFQSEQSPYEGVVMRSGYCFKVFLPDGAARGVPEAPDGGVGPLPPDPDRAESSWCAYAWPAARGESGERAFFVDGSGDVLACENEKAQYSGFRRAPQQSAAYSPDAGGSMADPPAANSVGIDGERWVVAN